LGVKKKKLGGWEIGFLLLGFFWGGALKSELGPGGG